MGGFLQTGLIAAAGQRLEMAAAKPSATLIIRVKNICLFFQKLHDYTHTFEIICPPVFCLAVA